MTSHVYGTFTKWYFAKLQTAPLLTNLSTGVMLMIGGDVLAQEMEIKRAELPVTNGCCDYDESIGISKRLNAEQEVVGEPLDYYHACADDDVLILATDSTLDSTLVDRHVAMVERLKEELAFWNPFRTGTMASWALVYVPFYASLYKAYDRYLPKRTPIGIVARVALSFVASVPVNAAFYTYGTAIEHTQEWYAKMQNRRDLNEDDPAVCVAYRFDQLCEKVGWKLENELPQTIQASAACWIPFNLFMFTVAPPHMQPLSLMSFSFFWNCYLSMSQHRSSLAAASQVERDSHDQL